MALPILPPQPEPDPSGEYTAAQAWAMLQARYQDSGNIAQWAAEILDKNLLGIESLAKLDVVSPELATLLALLDDMPGYTPGTVSTYIAPDAPSYDSVPTYSAPTMGTLADIPAVVDLTVPNVPSTAVTYTDSDFSDTLLTAVKAQLEEDIGAGHTGLGDAEAALMARHTARVTAERAAAYTELTTQFSARNFDLPPGALTAKQTEINNEGSKRLTDASADIMAESARLAVDYNKHVLSIGAQLTDLLSKLHDNKMMRAFESAKTAVQFAIEGFRATVDALKAKADLNAVAINATVATNEGTVKAFLGELEGQVAPIKAIAEVNKAKAESYSASVSAESASVQASALPEELKIKQADIEIRKATAQGAIAKDAAQLAIEGALREVNIQVETLKGLAQGAMQMIASAMNSVSSSTSFGYHGGGSTSYDGDINAKIRSNEKIAGV